MFAFVLANILLWFLHVNEYILESLKGFYLNSSESIKDMQFFFYMNFQIFCCLSADFVCYNTEQNRID